VLPLRRRLLVLTGVLALIAGLAVPASASAPGTAQGPNTNTDPYVLPVADGATITSLLTVNDDGAAGNGYEMVGIPDGIGVDRDGNRAFVYMNHELRDTQGIARRHGQIGAFASRLVIDRRSLAVSHGSDFVDPGVRFWDYPSGSYVTSGALFADSAAQELTFGRWCSSTLSDAGLFYSERERVGYTGQIYFGNEEDGDIGRAFGVLTDGRAQALPRLGLFQWENTIPANNRTATTVVMGQEDGPSGPVSQLWIYVGKKRNNGNAFDRAGLTNGLSYVLDAVDPAVTTDTQWRSAVDTGEAAPVILNEVPWNQSGAAQNAEAIADGLSMNRIEDGFWDPHNRNRFFFVTTEGGNIDPLNPGDPARDSGGLWMLEFENVDQPLLGGELTLLLDGSESIGEGEAGLNKPDNMSMDRYGNLLIQEDPGDNEHLARIIAYRVSDGAIGVVARFDANLFSPDSPDFWTQDEESSGIIDAEAAFGRGTFLFDAQVHNSDLLPPGTGPGTVEEYVESGQLMLLKVRDWDEVYGDT
jgi:hypothetical protein